MRHGRRCGAGPLASRDGQGREGWPRPFAASARAGARPGPESLTRRRTAVAAKYECGRRESSFGYREPSRLPAAFSASNTNFWKRCT
jgi:hypothetical protein